ncbi:hypothetical protein KA529_05025, partial [Candidatus Saccharibacteria bacterium]|nr:hypothetical protein [Candidatus Saccharibacteria bacterium]
LFIASLLDILIEQFSNLINIDNRIIFLLRKSYLKEPSPQPILTIVFYSLEKFGYFTYITTISDLYKLTDQKKFESL